jgi:hypothetical protein
MWENALRLQCALPTPRSGMPVRQCNDVSVRNPMSWWRVRMWRSAFEQRGCPHQWSSWEQLRDDRRPHRRRRCSECEALRISTRLP